MKERKQKPAGSTEVVRRLVYIRARDAEMRAQRRAVKKARKQVVDLKKMRESIAQMPDEKPVMQEGPVPKGYRSMAAAVRAGYPISDEVRAKARRMAQ